MVLVDHKLSESSLNNHIFYVFTSDFLTGCLFGGYLNQMLDQLFIICHIFSEHLVSIDEDDDPLLDDVGIKRVLFIVKKCLEDFTEGSDTITSEVILNIYYFFEKEEELSVSLRLELFQTVEDEVYDRFEELFVIDGEISDVV